MKYLQNLADWRWGGRAKCIAKQQKFEMVFGRNGCTGPHQRPEICPARVCWVGRGQGVVRGGETGLLAPVAALCLPAGPCLGVTSLQLPSAAPTTWIWGEILVIFISRKEYKLRWLFSGD